MLLEPLEAQSRGKTLGMIIEKRLQNMVRFENKNIIFVAKIHFDILCIFTFVDNVWFVVFIGYILDNVWQTNVKNDFQKKSTPLFSNLSGFWPPIQKVEFWKNYLNLPPSVDFPKEKLENPSLYQIYSKKNMIYVPILLRESTKG